MSRLTLRGRVTLAALGVLAVALAGLSFGFNALLAHRLDGDASSLLRERAAAQVATLDLSHGDVRVEEKTNDAALDHASWVYAGPRVVERPPGAASALEGAVADMARAGRRAERSAGTTRLLSVPIGASGRRLGSVVVGVSLVPYEHTRHIALVASIVLSLVLLAAALVAVRLSVRSALRPVAEMTARAADWSEHDLHRRFDLGEPRDELTTLAATFDGLLRRIEAVIRHEQRFSAEVAHELRTPLSGLRADTELELQHGNLPAGTRETLERTLGATARMESVIETLLSSARMTDGGVTGACDPMPPLREAVTALAGAAAAHDVAIGLGEPAERLIVDAAPEVVTQAVYPLLENGVHHARSRVDVALSRRDGEVTVSVADDGPGLAAAAADEVFAPGVSSTGGAGLGLPLSRRLARSCGGDVVAAQSEAGARFELRLPGGPESKRRPA